MLLAALEQFKHQATNRLLLAVLEESEDSGVTQRRILQRVVPRMSANMSNPGMSNDRILIAECLKVLIEC